MYIQEDWEFIHRKEAVYLYEYQMQIEEEWQQWLEEQERKEKIPASITILTEIPNKIKYETNI